MDTQGTSQTVDSRELKTRLGTYLRQVHEEGTRWIVTDRGRPVAELRPLERSAEPLEDRLRELVALSTVSCDANPRQPLPPFEPIKASGAPLSETLLEDRGDRC